ncbi:CHAP domain-containing protein [Cryobacterium sp. W22_MBD10_FK3]|uniref:CHAP domain-containing protein n=1 Tax=Cryobacterium sp. W22_MBD10_FK3 TaxID=3240273 RepID=UPI003F8D98BF
MTHSGTAGSPEGDGPQLTRREARALREAAEAAVVPAAETDSSAPAAEVVLLAVPVPPVPVLSVSPDLAVIVESASSTPAEPVVVAPAARARAGTLRSARLPSFSRTKAPSTAPSDATRRPAARVAKRRKPIAKLVTLLAIPAIFLTAALPSYAFAPQGGSAGASPRSTGETQAISVGAAAAAVSISADGFTATSQAELDEIEAGIEADLAQKAAAEDARASSADYAVVGIRAEGDDYPWRDAGTESQGGGLSPLGYYYRECVDFVAWRLNRDAGTTSPFKWVWSTMTPGGGNASAWANAWSNKGWASSKSPVVGAVAWFTYNHVAYVQSVPGDGTVVLEEYNWMGSHAYHTRTVPISEVPVYLYPPA